MHKMKKYLSITLAALLLTACAGTNQTDSGTSSGESGTVSSSGQSVDPSGQEASEVSVSVLENPEESAVAVTGDFTITQGAENKGGDAAVSVQGSVYTITAAGEYTLTGNLKDGQVIVKAGDEDEVKLLKQLLYQLQYRCPDPVFECGRGWCEGGGRNL